MATIGRGHSGKISGLRSSAITRDFKSINEAEYEFFISYRHRQREFVVDPLLEQLKKRRIHAAAIERPVYRDGT